jgi:Protein of unknown function (DUF3429)
MTPYRDATLPRPAAILGAAGLLPFVACALQIATGQPLAPRFTGLALYALTIYGAVVLSFLGGIQWGLAVGSADRSDGWRRYGLSVVPSFIAWAGVWQGQRNGLITLAIGIVVWALYELWSTGLGEAPSWYGRLRAALSTVAVASLGAAAYYGPF